MSHACLIASAQRVEHYETAVYGTLVAWARSMAHPEVADLLEETLNEEQSTDSKLSMLARDGINKKASAIPAAPMASAPRQRH
jgi:ferritin-like metal-binding protein YciE